MNKRDIRRGDIFFVEIEGNSKGHEQEKSRPAAIVSNDFCNKYSPVVEVVYCTSRQKKPLPTHTYTNALFYPSTIMCESVHSVDVNRLGNYMGSLSNEELDNVDRCLAISLGLTGCYSGGNGYGKEVQDA